VKIGDFVDVGNGHGLEARVVVIISSGEVVAGFSAPEWSYLKQGVMLQDQKVFGLLHLPEFNHEHILFGAPKKALKQRRAQSGTWVSLIVRQRRWYFRGVPQNTVIGIPSESRP
jgi:hypothetical protein